MPRRARAPRLAIGVVLAWLALPAMGAAAATTLAPTTVDSVNLISDSTTDGSEPEMAFDGTNFLMTWYHGTSVKAALLSPNGVIQSPGVITITTTNGYRPSVAFDGTNYLIAWTEVTTENDADREIRAVRISTAGVVLDDTQKVIGKNAKVRRISVDFDGTNYMAVWRTGADEIYGGRMSAGGTAQDGNGFAIGTGTHAGFYPTITFADGQYLAAWHGGNLGAGQDVIGAIVDTAGTAGTPFAIYTGAGDQEHVTAATDGTDFLVTWNDGARGNQQNFGGVSAALVAADGTVGSPIEVSDLNWRQGTKQTAAFDGTDYVVAWSEDKFPIKHRLSDIYARRVSTVGAIVDTDPIPVATGFVHQTGPGVGISGTRYVFVYFDPSCDRFGATCITERLMDRVSFTPPSIAGSPGSAPEVGTWERLTSPLNTQILTVFAFSDDSAFAGVEDDSGPDFASPLLAWNGTSWSNLGYQPNARKFGMWGSSPTHLWMASSFGNLVLWNGTNGTMFHGSFAEDEPFTLMGTGVDGFGSFRLVSVGVDGAVVRSGAWDQATWDLGWGGTCLTLDGQPDTEWGRADCDHLRGKLDNWDVAGNFPNDVYTVGEFGTVGRFTGTDWSLETVPTYGSVNGAYTSCAGDVYTVGDFGTILHRSTGGTWTRMASPTDEHLTSVAGFGPSDVYAVGNRGTIVHYDGSAWSPESSGTDNTLTDVAVGGETVWVVGSRDVDVAPPSGEGTILRKLRTITDATAPKNPQLVSHTHRNDDWWPVSTPRVHFEGGCDDGEGIAGYSVLFDHNTSTVPPATENLDVGATSYQETLADGEWYFHIRTVDRAGNWSTAAHHGPIRIDTQAPQNVSITGSDPAPGQWGPNDGDIRVDWEWTDNLSGFFGYSYEVDQSPTTEPDTNSIELFGTTDGLTVQTFNTGETWVHVRAIDLSDSGGAPPVDYPNQNQGGNVSATVHIGPFMIDGDPPVGLALSSSSHTLGHPSEDRTVDVVIGASSDPQSGVDGYSYRWIGGGDHDVDATKDIEEGTTTVTSEELANGSWSFAIRPIDNVGNVGNAVEIGTFEIGSGPAPPAGEPPPSGSPPPFAPAPIGAPLDVPSIASLRVSPATIRLGARIGGSIGLTRAGTVTFRVQRARPGRRVSGRCRPPSARLRRRPACTRWVNVRGTFDRALAAGRSLFTLRPSARMNLKRGNYRLVAVAANATGRSEPARVRFRIR